MSNETRFYAKYKVLMLKGENGERPTITTTPIENGHKITFAYSDGTSESVDLYNATSGDYSQLTNKPRINGVQISGDTTLIQRHNIIDDVSIDLTNRYSVTLGYSFDPVPYVVGIAYADAVADITKTNAEESTSEHLPINVVGFGSDEYFYVTIINPYYMNSSFEGVVLKNIKVMFSCI